MTLSAVARAHRAAASFSVNFPDIPIAVELSADLDELSAADPADPPDLRFILDDSIAVVVPMGSSEHTLVDRLKREWAAVVAPAEGVAL